MEGSRFNRHADRLVERHGQRVWRLGLDAGFACPHRSGGGRGGGGCAFCAPDAARAPYLGAAETSGGSPEPIAAQVGHALDFASRRYGAEAFFVYFQAYSCTNLPAERLGPIYDEALDALEALAPGTLRGMVVSTRPDCMDPSKAGLLADYVSRGLEVWLELGLQSAHDRTLLRLNRGHGAAAFLDAMRMTEGLGLRRAVHLILGLPGEDRADMLETMRFAADSGVEGVKFHDLRLVRGSALTREYLAGEMVPLFPGRLPGLLADCLEILPPRVEVIRLGADFPAGRTLDPFPQIGKERLYRKVEAELAARGSRQGSGQGSSLGSGKTSGAGRPSDAPDAPA